MDISQRSRLNRSFSASDIPIALNQPVSRRIFVQEIIEYSSHTPLIRQYSCERIYGASSFLDKPPNRLTTNTDSNIHKTTINYPSLQALNFEENCAPFPTPNNSEIPMEIDDTDFCETDPDLWNEATKKPRAGTRKLVVNNLTKTSEKPVESDIEVKNVNVKKWSPTFKNIICIGIAVVAFYIYVSNPYVYIDKNLQIESITRDLQQEVIGQSNAVAVVIKSLQEMDKWRNPIKVLPLVGGTGVGKTLIANVLKKHFASIVFEINGAHLYNLGEKEKISTNLQSCCCNLILIDDLDVGNTPNVINFITSLPSSNRVLILPIFNIQSTNMHMQDTIEWDNSKAINDLFQQSALYFETVVFNEITMRDLQMWLEMEMVKMNIPVYRHEELKSSILLQHELKWGFKGLHSKLALELGHYI